MVKKAIKLINSKYGAISITILIVLFFSATLVYNFYLTAEQQYAYLASSFLKGKLYFLENYGLQEDSVLIAGKYYWPLGPFPSVILLPFIYLSSLFNKVFYQGYLQFFISCGVFYLSYKIARKFKYSLNDSTFLAFAFCFSSIYQMIAFVPLCWYFVQAIVVFLIFISISEYFKKRRYWLIGLYFSFIFASRFTAGLGILFFVFDIITRKNFSLRKKIRSLTSLAIPIVISGLLLMSYNYLRFGNVFDNGYTRANNDLLTATERFELMNYGLFRIKNIPTNFYYYFLHALSPILVDHESLYGNTHFLKPPFVKVKYPGTSFFIISPIFLYIFRSNLKKRITKLSLIPTLVILPLLLSYYWPGWRQVGPRYLLDLLPFWYVLLLNSFRNFSLPVKAKFIIILSSLFNFYLFLTVFSA